MLSPFLFIFYPNEYTNLCRLKECRGIFVDEDHNDINMLLFADDLVLIGDRIGYVQKLET